MEWKTLLANITGTVDQELLLRNEYLVAENRILRKQITGRVRLTESERTTLAELGKREFGVEFGVSSHIPTCQAMFLHIVARLGSPSYSITLGGSS